MSIQSASGLDYLNIQVTFSDFSVLINILAVRTRKFAIITIISAENDLIIQVTISNYCWSE